MEDRPRLVLVVDDNSAHRYAKVKLLTVAGYAATEASTGEQALAMASKADAVLLDVFLPDIDGLEVCRRLRRDPATANLPIVHMSAIFTSAFDTEEGERAGGDAYLLKPIAPETLLATLEKVIARRGQARPGSGVAEPGG